MLVFEDGPLEGLMKPGKSSERIEICFKTLSGATITLGYKFVGAEQDLDKYALEIVKEAPPKPQL